MAKAGFLKLKGRATLPVGLQKHLEGRETARPDEALERRGVERSIDLGAEPERARLVVGEALAARAATRKGGRPPLQCIDALMSGPPAWNAADAWPLETVDAWSRDAVTWLRSVLPPDTPLATAHLHTDETSPHVHACFPPALADAKGVTALSWKRVNAYMAEKAAGHIVKPGPAEMRALQQSYFENVGRKYGLGRGKVGAKIEYAPLDRTEGLKRRMAGAEARVAEEIQRRTAVESEAAEELKKEQRRKQRAEKREEAAYDDAADTVRDMDALTAAAEEKIAAERLAREAAETRAANAETRATTAETRAATDTKKTTAELAAERTAREAAETRATTAETRATTAETRATTAETRATTADTKKTTAELAAERLARKAAETRADTAAADLAGIRELAQDVITNAVATTKKTAAELAVERSARKAEATRANTAEAQTKKTAAELAVARSARKAEATRANTAEAQTKKTAAELAVARSARKAEATRADTAEAQTKKTAAELAVERGARKAEATRANTAEAQTKKLEKAAEHSTEPDRGAAVVQRQRQTHVDRAASRRGRQRQAPRPTTDRPTAAATPATRTQTDRTRPDPPDRRQQQQR